MEKTFTIKTVEKGADKLWMVKLINDFSKIGLKGSKDFLDSVSINNKPNQINLNLSLEEEKEFLKRIEVLAWNSDVAEHYAILRADLEAKGAALGSLDMQIAAHAFEAGAVLVTNDQAFKSVKRLKVEDWTQ